MQISFQLRFCAPGAAHMGVNEVVDLDSTNPAPVDDDELQIVDERITKSTASRRHTAPQSQDDNDVIEIVEEYSVPPRVLDPEIAVVAEQSASSREPASKDTTCASCSRELSDDPDSVLLSRCKHTLCYECALRCITDSNAGPSAQQFTAASMRAQPMCVVRRCRAPISEADALNCLASLKVDDYCQNGFEAFNMWAEEDEAPTAVAGPSHIVFPEFTPEMATEAMEGDGEENEDELCGDDFAGAYGLLWLWDKDYIDDAGRSGGRWMCAACGAYSQSASLPDDDLGDPEVAIPDHPMYPHCASSRAYAVKVCVSKLSEIEEGAEKNSVAPTTKRKRTKRYRTAKSVTSSKRRRTTSKGFAKGTGYAGKSGAEWKGATAKMLENVKRVDAATAYWLARLRCYLVRDKESPPESWPCYMRVLLRQCKLTEHLAKVLINESIMDVGERVPVYVAALRVVAAMNDSPSLRVLVAEPCENGRSLASLIDSLSKQAALLSAGAGNAVLCPKTKLLIRQIRKSIRGVNRHNLLRAKKRANGFELRVSMNPRDYDALSHDVKIDKEEEEDKVSEERKKRYCDVMRELQFATVPGLASASSFRNHAVKASASTVGRGNAVRRLAGEVSSLFSSLPLSWSSTIIVRVDESKYNFLRACVFGPEDTPYECGAFLFDIFLPPDYPQSPPKFKLLTTGGGRVRFNPNLYANGKVCLSLLGTWSGPSWTPASTLLQVLVSIQSLILVSEPWFNEPGFESQIGTPSGQAQSDKYNAVQRRNTTKYAILEALKSPYNEFKVAIQAHFRLKRCAVEKCMRDWFNKPAGVAGSSDKGKNENKTNGSKPAAPVTIATPAPVSMLPNMMGPMDSAAAAAAAFSMSAAVGMPPFPADLDSSFLNPSPDEDMSGVVKEVKAELDKLEKDLGASQVVVE